MQIDSQAVSFVASSGRESPQGSLLLETPPSLLKESSSSGSEPTRDE
jgi:hypothetical protein